MFDNCTSPVLASTLDGYITHLGHRAFHIKDVPGLPGGRNAKDVDWINHLRSSPEVWIFVTGDSRVLKNPAERAALRSAGLHGFVLAPAYQKSPSHLIASTIVLKWPELEQFTKLVAAPSMFEIPIGKNTKLKQIKW
ncbi:MULTISPECIES: hypothetical protein [Labrys]|uniref:VapC45 PIN like domain-containing protein n=1 Tax=Labrys neptuniae TaxID=376174 RepID=A0ABV3PRE8_9HYPH|nr:hypothetical protein [Labrys sp. WJW]OCC00416.1 hypothetical protein BA190_34300 [Labrys sp. WJW]